MHLSVFLSPWAKNNKPNNTIGVEPVTYYRQGPHSTHPCL